MDVTVELTRPLPAALPAGSATAVLCIGRLRHPGAPLSAVTAAARPGPSPRPVTAVDRLCADGTRTGFWAVVVASPTAADSRVTVELTVAPSGGGAPVRVTAGEIDVLAGVRAPVAAAPQDDAAPTIAVCLATHEPDPALLATQLGSLRAQTDRSWICVISDDASGAAGLAEIERQVAGDPRFHLAPSPQRLGFYRNFERAIKIGAASAPLLALCDQDDRWHPDKLAVLRAQRGGAGLAYSDLRLVTADGRVRRDTLWRGRRNNHTDLASMLVANSITGAATLFTREVAELALPFPDVPGFQFHDHWLAAVALAAGDVAYVDRPLYDYVQHPGAVFGDVTHGRRGPRRHPGGALGRWRAAYFYGTLAVEVQARTLLVRCDDRLTPDKRRALERLASIAESPAALAWLAARGARGRIGATATLGTESVLASGAVWNRLSARAGAHAPRGPSRRGLTAAPELAAFSQRRLRRWRARF